MVFRGRRCRNCQREKDILGNKKKTLSKEWKVEKGQKNKINEEIDNEVAEEGERK
jgi:hypothetical protein